MKIIEEKEHSEEWDGKNGEVVTIISRERYGICPRCGRRVYFGGSGWAAGIAECDCGQWYNSFGQALKPPEDWEEEDWEEYTKEEWYWEECMGQWPEDWEEEDLEEDY